VSGLYREAWVNPSVVLDIVEEKISAATWNPTPILRSPVL